LRDAHRPIFTPPLWDWRMAAFNAAAFGFDIAQPLVTKPQHG
jgi:hypothetical protein